MHKILLNTPFGFVMELVNERVYELENPYEMLINGELFLSDTKNVISVFGLEPDSLYDVELKFIDENFFFEHKTEKAGFVLNVSDFGASGDGTKDDTMAINTAIYTAPSGSVVRLKKGTYMVSSVLLKSEIDLYLEEGAQICQIPGREHLATIKGYLKNYDHSQALANATWEGNPLDCFTSLIYGSNVEKIRIYGAGSLNGSGMESGFWIEHKTKNKAWRPRNLFLAHCNDITLAGITSQNSAAWNLHPFYSDNLKFFALYVKSDPNSPNTDGLNPDSSSNIEIVGCRFDVGDDCIAIKSGKFFMSRHHFKASENIQIRNCLMEQGHGGVVVGSEISCGARNVRVRQCLFRQTDRGLRIKTRRGRGSTCVIEDISVDNVQMIGVANCFTVNMFYNCDPDGHSDYVRSSLPLPVGDETPVVRDISLKNISACEISGSAIFLAGLPESPIRNIVVEHSFFSFLPNRNVQCPEMMTDEVLIKDLGIYIKNTLDPVLSENHFDGEHIVVTENLETAACTIE